jgi:hypothetical protein
MALHRLCLQHRSPATCALVPLRSDAERCPSRGERKGGRLPLGPCPRVGRSLVGCCATAPERNTYMRPLLSAGAEAQQQAQRQPWGSASRGAVDPTLFHCSEGRCVHAPPREAHRPVRHCSAPPRLCLSPLSQFPSLAPRFVGSGRSLAGRNPHSTYHSCYASLGLDAGLDRP